MTPLAERLLNAPAPRSELSVIRELLSGCQFFDASALEPIYRIRNPATPSEYVVDELLSASLPANSTWLQRSPHQAVLVSDREKLLTTDGRFVFCIGSISVNERLSFYLFNLLKNGRIQFHDPEMHESELHRKDQAQAIRWFWFALEAMQTPGGFTHEISKGPSRQQKRLASRNGTPEHRWIEVRLGRQRSLLQSRAGTGAETTLAWHYRRGHRVNHPNPNYPKWRKGCWVGSPENGIISHDYIVEGQL